MGCETYSELPLELQFQSQLNYARAAAAETWVALGDVWGLGDDTVANRDVFGVCSKCDCPARQREVRVIEDVKQLRAELNAHAVRKCSLLVQREIRIPIVRPVDRVSAKISERSVRRLGKRSLVQISA